MKYLQYWQQPEYLKFIMQVFLYIHFNCWFPENMCSLPFCWLIMNFFFSVCSCLTLPFLFSGIRTACSSSSSYKIQIFAMPWLILGTRLILCCFSYMSWSWYIKLLGRKRKKIIVFDMSLAGVYKSFKKKALSSSKPYMTSPIKHSFSKFRQEEYDVTHIYTNKLHGLC